MVSPWSKLFVAVVVVLGAPKFLKFVAVAVVVPSILGLLVVLLLSLILTAISTIIKIVSSIKGYLQGTLLIEKFVYCVPVKD